MQLELSEQDIRQEIRGFQARLSEARRKLAGLPVIASDWQARKKLRIQRQALEAEVSHVEGLIGLAREALEKSQTGSTRGAGYWQALPGGVYI